MCCLQGDPLIEAKEWIADTHLADVSSSKSRSTTT